MKAISVRLALALLTLCAGAAMAASPPPRVDSLNVTLIDQDGRDVVLADLMRRHQVVIVSFFFTGCGAICPAQTAVLRAARRELSASDDILMVSISLTPEIDRPPQLRAYAAQFNIVAGREQGWVFLTGSRADVARVTAAFSVRLGAAADHPNLLWIGDLRRDEWRMTSASNPPSALIALARDIVR